MRPFLSYTYYNIVRKEKKEISTKEKSQFNFKSKLIFEI